MEQNKGIVIVVLLITVVVATVTLTETPLTNLQAVNAIESVKTIVHAGGG
jgi:hypothetical protein